MKAITFQDVRTLAYEDVPDPEIVEPADVIVEVTAAGLCGSDLHPWAGRETGLDRGTVMGHELVGRVVETGGAVEALRPGDRVVAPFTTSCGVCFYCRTGLTARCVEGELFGWVQDGRGLHGAQAERVRVPLADSTLVAVPDSLEDDAVAVLAGDVLSTALYGAELAGVGVGDVVVVVGCGPVGLLAILAALEAGAREVLAVDLVPSRLDVAGRLGALPVNLSETDGIGAARERTEGRGADRAIEAVGSPEATRTAASLLRPGGSIGALGVHTEDRLAIAPGEMYDLNLRYAAGRCPARRILPRALALAERKAEALAGLISHRLPLSEGVEAYRPFADREPGWTKVVFLPGVATPG